MPSASSLFRIDNAKENDHFFRSWQPRVNDWYAGLELQVVPGWVPDLVLVECDAVSNSCMITVIELEATKLSALRSSRKYLHEDPTAALAAFKKYLDRVIGQCKQTADRRAERFEDLREFLRSCPFITLYAAAGLRTGSELVEREPLVKQAQSSAQDYPSESKGGPQPSFTGSLALTPHETKVLYRALFILDAVVRQNDLSAATLKHWLNLRTQPLRQAVRLSGNRFPELQRFLSHNKRSGLRFSSDAIFGELSIMWADAGCKLDREHVRELVRSYYPLAAGLRSTDSVKNAFNDAKRSVSSLRG